MKSAQRNREEAAGGATLPEWPELPWFDFLKVMRAEPVVVKGAFGFGLKAIAKNLYKHGLIDTSWEDGPVDGLGAMVGAWYCNRQVAETGQSMRDMDYMQEIEAYNEVDCKVMWELVNYLRENHI
jgi:predicted RecB family nuclease